MHCGRAWSQGRSTDAGQPGERVRLGPLLAEGRGALGHLRRRRPRPRPDRQVHLLVGQGGRCPGEGPWRASVAGTRSAAPPLRGEPGRPPRAASARHPRHGLRPVASLCRGWRRRAPRLLGRDVVRLARALPAGTLGVRARRLHPRLPWGGPRAFRLLAARWLTQPGGPHGGGPVAHVVGASRAVRLDLGWRRRPCGLRSRGRGEHGLGHPAQNPAAVAGRPVDEHAHHLPRPHAPGGGRAGACVLALWRGLPHLRPGPGSLASPRGAQA